MEIFQSIKNYDYRLIILVITYTIFNTILFNDIFGIGNLPLIIGVVQLDGLYTSTHHLIAFWDKTRKKQEKRRLKKELQEVVATETRERETIVATPVVPISVARPVGTIIEYMQPQSLPVRYIYYIEVQLLIWILKLGFWQMWYNHFYFVGVILSSPAIMEWAVQVRPEVIKFQEFIFSQYEKLVIRILCKYTAKCVNYVSKDVLKTEVHVYHQECQEFIEKITGINDTKNYRKKYSNQLKDFIKTFLSVSLVHYLSVQNYTVSKFVLKRLLVSTTKFESKKDDRAYVVRVLQCRDWSKFFEPDTLYKILRMYAIIENETTIVEFIQKKTKRIKKRVQSVIVSWTIASLMGRWLDSPLFSCLLAVFLITGFKKKKWWTEYYGARTGIIGGALFLIWNGTLVHSLTTCLLAEYGLYLFLNDITRDAWKNLPQKFRLCEYELIDEQFVSVFWVMLTGSVIGTWTEKGVITMITSMCIIGPLYLIGEKPSIPFQYRYLASVFFPAILGIFSYYHYVHCMSLMILGNYGVFLLIKDSRAEKKPIDIHQREGYFR